MFLRWYDIDSLENRDPVQVERVYRLLARPFRHYFRGAVRGVEQVPSGAALLVGNHNSGILTPDSFLLGLALYETYGLAGLPYGLAHEIAIGLPLAHQVAVPLGAVRASHDLGRQLLARQDKVLVYPGGDLEAMRPFSQRNRIVFGGRRGYIRLALTAAVPIVPVVAVGAHATFLILHDLRPLARLLGLDRLIRLKVWPLTLSIPWGLTLGPPLLYLPYPTRITIEILPPIRFDRAGAEAAADETYVGRCARQVESRMQEALDRLAAER